MELDGELVYEDEKTDYEMLFKNYYCDHEEDKAASKIQSFFKVKKQNEKGQKSQAQKNVQIVNLNKSIFEQKLQIKRKNSVQHDKEQNEKVISKQDLQLDQAASEKL